MNFKVWCRQTKVFFADIKHIVDPDITSIFFLTMKTRTASFKKRFLNILFLFIFFFTKNELFKNYYVNNILIAWKPILLRLYWFIIVRIFINSRSAPENTFDIAHQCHWVGRILFSSKTEARPYFPCVRCRLDVFILGLRMSFCSQLDCYSFSDLFACWILELEICWKGIDFQRIQKRCT